MSARPVFRFAPSPNGPLHLGHAFCALTNQRLAAAQDGALLLRIENIDLPRCTPAFEEAIHADLAWLGLRWSGPVLHQSDHFDRYAAALDTLAGRGLVYPCFCTRGEVARAIAGRPDWPSDPDGSPLYPGTCRGLARRERNARIAAGRPYALRFAVEAALRITGDALSWIDDHGDADPIRYPANPRAWGDAVLRRKDIPASYHIAVVVDDALQGVTDVVRGRDLFAATGLHRLLQATLGLPEPRYHHHRLILDEAGQKLAKSQGAQSLADLRRAGVTPEAVRRQLGLA